VGRVHAFLVMFRRLADIQRRAYLAHAACALQTCKRRELVVIEGMQHWLFQLDFALLAFRHSQMVHWGCFVLRTANVILPFPAEPGQQMAGRCATRLLGLRNLAFGRARGIDTLIDGRRFNKRSAVKAG
jgi:hypothetical protein